MRPPNHQHQIEGYNVQLHVWSSAIQQNPSKSNLIRRTMRCAPVAGNWWSLIFLERKETSWWLVMDVIALWNRWQSFWVYQLTIECLDDERSVFADKNNITLSNRQSNNFQGILKNFHCSQSPHTSHFCYLYLLIRTQKETLQFSMFSFVIKGLIYSFWCCEVLLYGCVCTEYLCLCLCLCLQM